MNVKIVNDSGFENPRYETVASAGMDIKTTLSYELQPFERKVFPTGLYFEIPEGFEMQIRPRSGLAVKQGITVLNAPGTIDADYRGELGVILINLNNKPVLISKGDRIAQAVFSAVEHVRLDNVEKLSETTRGSGGFGSTGVN